MSSSTLHCFIVQLRNIMLFMTCVFILIVYRETKHRVAKFSENIPKTALPYIMFDEYERPPRNIFRLRRLIRENNELEAILNSETYGPIKHDTVILVIHVSRLTQPLKYLVMSLSEVRGIEEVLLIFSHSYYDENFNKFVRLIDFCRVLQLFYPYSVQARPNTFPGLEPHDCPHDMDTEKAKKLNCTGAYTPDSNGKYRQPELAEKKHHWWWTANKIFEDLKFSSEFDDTVVFLDEDLFVLEDFLYMVMYMRDAARSQNQCEFLYFGTTKSRYTKRDFSEENLYSVSVVTWDPKYHASALAFDMATWNKIVTHYDLFCNVDDYLWSRSLLQISLFMKDNSERFKVMTADTPRAYKTTQQGYYSLLQSSPLNIVLQLIDLQRESRDNFYPAILQIYTDIELPSAELDGLFNSESGGGWNDPRDKEFCGNLTKRKIKKELFETALEFRQEHLLA